ncbi:hypothetical protein KC901_02290, partial [Patescibacteria group bacterium]|nr:hypothetical protein [Patescibacteria group bacterium]
MNFGPYYDALAFLENLGKLETPLEYMRERKPEDLGKYLLRTQELLDRIGNPEQDFKYIHVTGTAGKGTTTALLHTILCEAGYTVGSTSSPATTTTIERIQVNDCYIDPDAFGDIVESLKPAIRDMYLNSEYGKPSYFDIILAVALVYFKQQKCEWVVLEVGMGGRYDSTNIISHPVVTAITNIGFDHTHLLGNTLEEIAYEKAGIIKPHSAFFTTEQHKECLQIFQNECKEQGATYTHVSYSGDSNIALVRAIGEYLNIDSAHTERGITNTKLPCRFETVSEKPLTILDGAHNVSKTLYSLKKLDYLSYGKLHVVFGAGETKDALGMLDQIAPLATSISLCPVISPMWDSFSLKDMDAHLKTNYPNLDVVVFLDAHEALEHAEE